MYEYHIELKIVFRTGFFFEKVLKKIKYVMMIARINGVDSRGQNFSITSTKKTRDLPEKSCKNRVFLNIHAVKKMGGLSPPRVWVFVFDLVSVRVHV